ncbi:MAG: hypothetical protein ACOCVR_02370 [Myxococcota bacterium]
MSRRPLFRWRDIQEPVVVASEQRRRFWSRINTTRSRDAKTISEKRLSQRPAAPTWTSDQRVEAAERARESAHGRYS